MYQKFIKTYTDLKAIYLYVEIYTKRARIINNSISFFLLAIGAASITNWVIWNRAPMVWSALLAISQILSLGKNYFVFQKRVDNSRFALPELQSLFDEMDKYLSNMQVYGLDEKELISIVHDYRTAVSKLTAKFLPDDVFPYNEKIMDKASERATLFFEREEVKTYESKEAAGSPC